MHLPQGYHISLSENTTLSSLAPLPPLLKMVVAQMFGRYINSIIIQVNVLLVIFSANGK